MDLQTYLSNAVAVSRAKSLAQSDQLTLGEAIAKLEPIVNRQPEIIKKYEHEAEVRYDFEYLFPTDLMSWRGIYAELALNFEADGTPMKVTAFCEMLKGAVGKTFEGYKGGDFTMSRQTPIWVARYGNSGNTALIDVIDGGYTVLLVTAYRET